MAFTITENRLKPTATFIKIPTNVQLKNDQVSKLSHSTKRICETKHIAEELKHLKEFFQANKYSRVEIKYTLYPRRRIVKSNQKTKLFSG